MAPVKEAGYPTHEHELSLDIAGQTSNASDQVNLRDMKATWHMHHQDEVTRVHTPIPRQVPLRDSCLEASGCGQGVDSASATQQLMKAGTLGSRHPHED